MIACPILTYSHFPDIEAQIRELQNKKKGLSEIAEKEKERVSLGNTGFFDQEIYGGTGKFEGDVTSIAPNGADDVSTYNGGLAD